MKRGNKLHNEENFNYPSGNKGQRNLILYNDDENEFGYVIESLIEVCNHDSVQAEQCAYLAHYRGRCEVKSGKMAKLRKMKSALIDRGLRVEVQ
jgi:ATP-dependent Clp protease adaptor protein ClpS